MKPSELPPDLIYLTDDKPGITRKKYGRGFAYYHPETGHIRDDKDLLRIKNLVIPPAWGEVWIAPIENAHLQATGRDTLNRKQYRYHDLWNEYSTSRKYKHLAEFGLTLPLIRKRYTQHLRREEWDYKKVAALAVAVMDTLKMRVGSNYYSRVNHSYGLTTLRRKHLNLQEDKLNLKYVGKTGKERRLSLENKKLVRLIKECSELPGYELFRFQTQDGMKQLKSEDFNEYLRLISENDSISAKDFRTWGANVLCLKKAPQAKEMAENSRKKLDNILIKLVAKELGHTVNTCKTSYLNPNVLQYAINNDTQKEAHKKIRGDLKETEALLMELLENNLDKKPILKTETE
jgi:DNA topoisomerase-1